MIPWPWRRVGKPDLDTFFAELQQAHPGKKNYTKMDRYRDFKRVFQDNDQGRRVLYEILLLCHVTRPSAELARFDPYETMFLDGESSIGMKIITIMGAEPSVRPTSTKEK